jgi:hypothetical protein
MEHILDQCQHINNCSDVSLISMLHSDVQILQYKNQQGNHEKEA